MANKVVRLEGRVEMLEVALWDNRIKLHLVVCHPNPASKLSQNRDMWLQEENLLRKTGMRPGVLSKTPNQTSTIYHRSVNRLRIRRLITSGKSGRWNENCSTSTMVKYRPWIICQQPEPNSCPANCLLAKNSSHSSPSSHLCTREQCRDSSRRRPYIGIWSRGTRMWCIKTSKLSSKWVSLTTVSWTWAEIS